MRKFAERPTGYEPRPQKRFLNSVPHIALQRDATSVSRGFSHPDELMNPSTKISTNTRWFHTSTDHVQIIPTNHDLDISGQKKLDLYDPAHIAGWEPYKLHDLGHVSWVGSVLGSVLYTDSTQHFITAIAIYCRS